jgi:copper chaperone CopZ
MTTYDLQIQGMSCGHCVMHVREALGKVPGVHKVDVEIGKARVEVGPEVAEAALVKAIADVDYEVVKTTRA